MDSGDRSRWAGSSPCLRVARGMTGGQAHKLAPSILCPCTPPPPTRPPPLTVPPALALAGGHADAVCGGVAAARPAATVRTAAGGAAHRCLEHQGALQHHGQRGLQRAARHRQRVWEGEVEVTQLDASQVALGVGSDLQGRSGRVCMAG